MFITDSPDRQKALDRIKILLDLEKNCDPVPVFGFTILQAIRNKVNGQDIIDFIKSQAKDNKDLVARIIGDDLLNRINQF